MSRMPKSAAMAWSSQLPLRGHWRQSFGWVLSMSSSTLRRILTISGSCVTIFMPGAASVQQARSSLGEPTARTMQIPQAAQGVRSGW